jgi:hypothetical protein
MKSLAVRWARGVAQLVDRSENDTSGGVEIGLKDLNHGGSLSVKLQDTTFGPSRRIIYRLGQFDNVELRDFLSYCHRVPMLGAWIGGDLSWCTISIGVVPRNRYWGTSSVHGKFNVDPVFDPPPFVPSVFRARKNFSDLWRPLHAADAMERRRTCVELESGLWFRNYTEGVRL